MIRKTKRYHARRQAIRGRVWARFPMYDIPECDEESENEEKGKAAGDPVKPHDDLSKIITTPPPEDENKFDPAKWLESASGPGLDTPNEPHAGSNSDDNEPIGADRPETTHIEEVPEVHEAKQRPEDKPSSILTLEEASEIVNQVISIGLHSWEFKWSADGDDKKAYRLGWTKVIPGVARPMPRRRTSYIVRSPKSRHASAEGNSGSSSQEGRGRPTQKNETKQPLDIAFRPRNDLGSHTDNREPRNNGSKQESAASEQKSDSRPDTVDDISTDIFFFAEYDGGKAKGKGKMP